MNIADYCALCIENQMNNDDSYRRKCLKITGMTQPSLLDHHGSPASRTLSEPINSAATAYSKEALNDAHDKVMAEIQAVKKKFCCGQCNPNKHDIEELKIEINDLMNAIVRLQSRINKL